MLSTISPDDPEFDDVMTEVWEWTQAHPRNYCANGGEMTLSEYLAFSRESYKKQVAVIRKRQMVALLTIDMFASRNYQFHVTAPIGTPADVLREAILTLGQSLFGEMMAECVFTACPVFNGVERSGMVEFVKSCGMTENGQSIADFTRDGIDVLWREYAITRTQYYEQSQTSQYN